MLEEMPFYEKPTQQSTVGYWKDAVMILLLDIAWELDCFYIV